MTSQLVGLAVIHSAPDLIYRMRDAEKLSGGGMCGECVETEEITQLDERTAVRVVGSGGSRMH